MALSADETRLVGQGDTFEEALEQAKQNDEADPLLLLVPDEWIPRVMSGR